ncbi:hypothetical protein, partial [Rickettsia endosymbiont of Cardiosporidium cionae]|uniref:hypothetical protein n=1 Tax=Rickettsia endosymbiont of Cardiosporidium cionae TaxID=2777155 RepID=UPI001E2E9AD4
DVIKFAKFYVIGNNVVIEDSLYTEINKNIKIYKEFIPKLEQLQSWVKHDLLDVAKIFIKEKNIKMQLLCNMLRIALTGTPSSPSIFDIMQIIGKIETLRRIKKL